MPGTIIICALSRLLDDPREQQHTTFKFGRKTYTGVQTNVAPVKCLLDFDVDREATIVVCLRSDECNKKVPGLELSTWDYFVSQIRNHCEANGMPTPDFISVSYSFENPERSLPSLMGTLESLSVPGTPTSIDVDLTGGGRDATALLALVSQAIAEQPDFLLGHVVYANYASKEILEQDGTFQLVDLVKSAQAFTVYAQADSLCKLFLESNDCSPETRELCKSMKAFSDDLSLCQVNSITREVENVRRGLEELHQAVTQYAENSSSPSERIADAETGRSNLSRRELNMLKLMSLDLGSPYSPSEMLFAALAPSIEQAFIPKGRTEGQSVFEAIRWCARHHLLQQALCIFTEHMGRCLIELGYIEPTASFKKGLTDRERNELVRGIYDGFDINDAERGSIQALREDYSVRIHGSKDDALPVARFFSVRHEMDRHLAVVVPWLQYIKKKRNLVAHSDSNIHGDEVYRRSCALLGKDPSEPLEPDAITMAIEDALRCIEENGQRWSTFEMPTSNRSVGKLKAYIADKGYAFIAQENGDPDLFVTPKDAAHCGLSQWQIGSRVEFDVSDGNKPGKQIAVNIRLLEEPTIKNLEVTLENSRSLILRYAKENDWKDGPVIFNINEGYNTWASENGLPKLTKEALGLTDKTARINKTLAEQFPDTFKALSGGRVEILPDALNRP